MHWLSRTSKLWLLVIDNADDPEMDVSKYFPAGGGGHIIITTRNPSVSINATVGQIRFTGMDPEEAITLLLRSAYPQDDSNGSRQQKRPLAQGIASELGYLALALAQAGATIRRNIYTIERYLHYYLGHRRKMMSYPKIRSAEEANIISTWEIPFQRIVRRRSAEHRDAVDLMHVFAFMHFESIPESVFHSSWEVSEVSHFGSTELPGIFAVNSIGNEDASARLRRAIGILCEYSIIDHDPIKGFCSFHPVVHEWARERLAPEEQNKWLTYATAILARCISSSLEPSGQKFRRLLLPHIDSCLRALQSRHSSLPDTAKRAIEIERFASVYAENGLWKQARALQERVVDFRVKVLGRRHGETTRAQRSLGLTLWNLFEIEKAIRLQLQVLKSHWLFRPSFADWMIWPPWKPDHVSYCLALDDLTLTLWLAGIRDRSKQTGERAVNGLMKRLGPEDPRTLNAMFNLGRTYLHLGDQRRCRELFLWVIRLRKRFFGMDHPDTLMTRNEIGMSMCARKVHLAVAERLVKNVLEARKKSLGEEHAYTLWSINDLSKIYCERGRPHDAAKMLEEIIPIIVRTLGERHVGMSMTRANLARAYFLADKWNEAEDTISKLLPMIPRSHPDWVHAMSGYVQVRIHLGQLKEAERDANELLDMITEQKVLALDHPRTVAIAEQLFVIYRRQGQLDRIREIQQRVPVSDEKKNMTLFDMLPVERALEDAGPLAATPSSA